MPAKRFRTVLTAFFFAALRCLLYPATWYAGGDYASPYYDGTTPERPIFQIQEAVDVAQDGDTVIVLTGAYDQFVRIEGKAITLRSVNPTDRVMTSLTVITLGARVVGVSWGECMLSGLTFGGGTGRLDWAGLSLSGSTVFVSNCVIYGHHLEKGYAAGLYCSDSSLTMRGCEVYGNIARYADQWAGIYLRDSEATISDCSVHDNTAAKTAGIYCLDSDLTITACSIFHNVSQAAEGSVFVDDLSSATLKKCLIYLNSRGPAIRGSGMMTIENCTLFGNDGGISGSEQTKVTNCILWNRRDELIGCRTDYSCVRDGEAVQGNTSLFPHFVNPGLGDFHLRSWSPCVDAGAPWSDFENEAAPSGGCVNMGAYGNTFEAASASADLDADGLPDDWEIHWFGGLSEGPDGDYDGDGQGNLEEYRSGSDPKEGGRILYVDASLGDDRLDGRLPLHDGGTTGPLATLRAAMSLAYDGDVIEVAPGTYYEKVDFLGKRVHLISTGGPQSTTIDGYLRGPAVSMTWGEAPGTILEGFKITNGRSAFGGGIRCRDSSPRILDCEIVGNYAAGDGMRFWGYGGGIACVDAEVTLERCAVHGNVSGDEGGAIFCQGSGLNLVKCAIHNNTWYGYLGGAVHLERARAMITQCVIRDNARGRDGGTGGIHAVDSSVEIREGLVVRNGPGSYPGAGAICCDENSPLYAVNCTFFENKSPKGAIQCAARISKIVNCIFFGNGPSEVKPWFSCVDWEAEGKGNTYVEDPLFVDFSADDFRLLPESPCVDAGGLAAVLRPELSLTGEGARLSWRVGEDLDGNPRISGAGVDMGAYEYQSTLPTFVIESSSDLKEWMQAGTTTGLEWIDSALSGLRQKFYRLGLFP